MCICCESARVCVGVVKAGDREKVPGCDGGVNAGVGRKVSIQKQ